MKIYTFLPFILTFHNKLPTSLSIHVNDVQLNTMEIQHYVAIFKILF